MPHSHLQHFEDHTDHFPGVRKVVELPLTADGWHLYTYDYMTQDGSFSGYLYALDMGHAEQLLAEMRATAVLAGRMIEAEIPE